MYFEIDFLYGRTVAASYAVHQHDHRKEGALVEESLSNCQRVSDFKISTSTANLESCCCANACAACGRGLKKIHLVVLLSFTL